jgi:DNA polymerase III delta prime subunit
MIIKNWFEKYCKNTKSYSDLNSLLKKATSEVKGQVSEEYWRRWLWTTTHAYGALEIYNANDPKARSLGEKFPELKRLNVGHANCPLIDLIIEYENEYTLVSCKWYQSGLTLDNIGAFEGLMKEHGYSSLRDKILITNAPRSSAVAEKIFGSSKISIKIFEDEFDVEDGVYQQLISKIPSKQVKHEKFTPRNERERLSRIRNYLHFRNNTRGKFQGPPGVGKTDLMAELERWSYKVNGSKGLTLSMADSVLSLKQNFTHFNQQDSASGTTRPQLVICSGADDADMVDWPVNVVGNDTQAIYQWLMSNPDGRVWCFYGNTMALQSAVQAAKTEFIFGSFDEASRMCQPIGSGWSHALYDHLIPIKRRFFVDATHRNHKKVGMDQPHLFGTMTDYVTQPEAEKWKSTCTYEVLGLSFDAKMFALNEKFHARRFVKGKTYTVEDKAMMYQLLSLYAKDPSMAYNLSFALTIERCKLLKDCASDVIQELQAAHPKNKRYQELSNIHLYVADTKKDTTRDIRDHLKHIYTSNKYKRSIVFTSRLLYRAWSQTKIDSVMFADNFKSISYIVQALGRGLRYDKNRPDKVCRVIIPVDINQTGPWSHFVSLLNRLKNWDYRPVESILALINKPRSKAKRKPGGGQVFINVNGVTVPINSLIAGLKHHILNNTDWENWTVWHSLAKEYFAKLEAVSQYLIKSPTSDHRYHFRIYQELSANTSYRDLIAKHVHRNVEAHQYLRAIMQKGSYGIMHMDEFIKHNKVSTDSNRRAVSVVMKEYFDAVQEIRRNYPFASQEKIGYQRDEFMAAVKQVHNKHWPYLQKFFVLKKESHFLRHMIHGKRHVLNFDPSQAEYYQQEIVTTNKIIAEQRTQKIAEVTKACIEEHERNFTPFVKLKQIIAPRYPEMRNRYWSIWVYKQSTKNQYTDTFLKYKKTPLIQPGRSICMICETKPVMANGSGLFLKVCASRYCAEDYRKNFARKGNYSKAAKRSRNPQ